MHESSIHIRYYTCSSSVVEFYLITEVRLCSTARVLILVFCGRPQLLAPRGNTPAVVQFKPRLCLLVSEAQDEIAQVRVIVMRQPVRRQSNCSARLPLYGGSFTGFFRDTGEGCQSTQREGTGIGLKRFCSTFRMRELHNKARKTASALDEKMQTATYISNDPVGGGGRAWPTESRMELAGGNSHYQLRVAALHQTLAFPVSLRRDHGECDSTGNISTLVAGFSRLPVGVNNFQEAHELVCVARCIRNTLAPDWEHGYRVRG